jgi:hypothetical protein
MVGTAARQVAPYQTCHRRFQQGASAGTLVEVRRRWAADLLAGGRLDLGGNLDRRWLQRGPQGGRAVGPTGCGNGSQSMAIADHHGLPVAVGMASASSQATQLVEASRQQGVRRATPQRRSADMAYDRARLDARLAQQDDPRLIAPHKPNRRAGPKARTDASCAATAVAGGSNGGVPGCITSALCSSARSITRPTASPRSTAVVSSSCSGTIYEMASNWIEVLESYRPQELHFRAIAPTIANECRRLKVPGKSRKPIAKVIRGWSVLAP